MIPRYLQAIFAFVISGFAMLPTVAIRQADAEDISFAQIARGRYLVEAGDCVSCHTAEKGALFAGGRAVATPFGTIYSPNLTPDAETGLGRWSEEDFYRAMHLGIGPDGGHLYPAFPYPYFSKLTRTDVTAIKAYLDSLPPVRNQRPASELVWPLNHRVFMRGWNLMFFTPETFAPDRQKSAEWNRGAYLVEGAGHCGACHTPKSWLGSDKNGEKLQGGALQNWFAPSLVNDQRNGLGSWSVDDVVEYLKTGRNSHSGATGLMSEVVANSTSKLTDEDLHAIAVYVKDRSSNESQAPAKPQQKAMDAGKAIFADSCAGCHQADGKGVGRMFPPLAHNANVQSDDPTSVIRVVVAGARTVPTKQRPTPSTMPAYNWKLSDDEIAAVTTYVRNAWGNTAPAVSAGEVKSLRRELGANPQ